MTLDYHQGQRRLLAEKRRSKGALTAGTLGKTRFSALHQEAA
jgi:hypothetical protein